MIDVTTTTAPKSDQLNSDDLIGRTMTIKVTKVSLLGGEQPFAINFEGDNGKPYKPCKSMRRVMVQIWGPDGNAYIGRSMTLYRDEKVTFGGGAVGGIRISHMSHMEGPITMALTASKANRRPFTVQPLVVQQDNELPILIAAGDAAASSGVDSLQTWWKSIGAAKQNRVKDKLPGWKTKATAPKIEDGEIAFDQSGDPEPEDTLPGDR